MSLSRYKSALIVLVLAGLLVLLLPVGIAVSQEIQQVFVTNFPSVQEVRGTVAVRGPIAQTSLLSFKEVIVPPVQPRDTTRLISGGTLIADGFSTAVFSLTGQVRGENLRTGTVGAFLIPEEDSVTRAFDEKGLMLFPLQVEASSILPTTSYFASSQPRVALGFPRYRILLYNTTDKSVSVNLFAYLTGD